MLEKTLHTRPLLGKLNHTFYRSRIPMLFILFSPAARLPPPVSLFPFLPEPQSCFAFHKNPIGPKIVDPEQKLTMKKILIRPPSSC
jgi:hypothetical protein